MLEKQRVPTGDNSYNGDWTVSPSSPTSKWDKVDGRKQI